MARSWPSIRVELIEGGGRTLWPRPGRVFAVARSRTFAALADAIDTAFARSDRAHLCLFELADTTNICGPIRWEDPPPGSVFAGDARLSRLTPGEQLLYTFDMGDDWTLLCTVGEQRIDPIEALGRVQKSIFIARYLRDRDLQREIEEGLNLIEAWNRVNGVIFYGKSGEFATNRRDQQELGMLSLHILQATLVYINTLMIQDILAEPEWAGVLTPEDLRGLTPLFWAHVLPYGEVKLNMTRRLALNAAQTVETNAESS